MDHFIVDKSLVKKDCFIIPYLLIKFCGIYRELYPTKIPVHGRNIYLLNILFYKVETRFHVVYFLFVFDGYVQRACSISVIIYLLTSIFMF